MTKFSHSSADFINETRNETLSWADPITLRNKTSQSQYRVWPPLASVLLTEHAKREGKTEESCATLGQPSPLVHAASWMFWDGADIGASLHPR